MRLLVASDLDFEFQRGRGAALASSLAPADVLVCAGDLAVAPLLGEALALLLERYSHVVFVEQPALWVTRRARRTRPSSAIS
jgi:hypothetical protein